ncbi:MAG: cytochrome ubiquinol oxidase subunit I [Mediterranea sp.]|jgi:cytochrome d ubiquinol oxidase subunit I|nr:cytochrome ubiquinol oxidase subunit I [Mediterranea sp.]
MIDSIDTSLIDWSRAQFAMTAMYHWIFVPLTLGLAVVMGIMETLYFKTGNEFWKRTAKFWMKLFGINFAVGVATGLILEFEFGTNWSNYSWFVGDIFGAPLAIEGIIAFFMEATFIAVMFFGWDKVSKKFHLASTWLTGLGATISAWWILVANAWMQHPVGMEFNPATARNEMVSFLDVALSPVAVNKFYHTVLSGWVLGAIFVIGISCWFLLKKRNRKFALASIKIGAIFGLVASLLSVWTGDGSAYQVAQTQPMKLAAAEALYEGGNHVGLIGIGALNPNKESYDDGQDPFLFKIQFPGWLSFFAERDFNGYVPGIKNIIEGGYTKPDGTVALSASEMIARGKKAQEALVEYRKAQKDKDAAGMEQSAQVVKENMPYFGYGYIKDVKDLVPNVPLNFYAFRVMVILGGYFILFFIVVLYLIYKKDLSKMRWMHWVALWTIPLGYIAGQAGWIVAECGRQPWAIRDLMPVNAAISRLSTSSVQITFFIFLILFTIMLIAEIGIMLKAIKKGPELVEEATVEEA